MQTATTGIKEELLSNRLSLKNVLDRPYGAEARMLREDQIKEGFRSIGLIKVIEKELCTLISATDFNTSNEKESQLASIVGMVYTMIVEERVDEVEQAFKTAFPEYYL